ncbi:MAG: lactate utilization protein C [Pseudonocardiaceae bacterium]|nr:lactate utilization protein C [Pseudonocardiaceae bacterium]
MGAPRPAATPVPRDYQRSRGFDDVESLFVARACEYKASVHLVESAPETIASTVDARGMRRMVAPDDVPESWLAAGVDWVRDAGMLDVATLDSCDGALTGCALAIAETGTIVLDAGARQGRRVITLVPDYHLCVLRASQIVGTVPEAVAELDPVRPLTFISGPSATSDIELDRVEGVHGPRTLDILLITS